MTRPFIRTGCIVIDAVGAMKLRFAATASGTPIECPPPRTSETVGFDIPAMSSAIASPASTSPPTVLSSISSPVISGLSSIAASIGRTCSYFVVFTSSGRIWCPSIWPIMLRQCMLPCRVCPSSVTSFISAVLFSLSAICSSPLLYSIQTAAYKNRAGS